MDSRYKISLAKIESFTYLLLIVLLPTQLGKHFWPSFSFVNGLRIDYLSPTLYVTDILIFILFILYVYKHGGNTWRFLNSKYEARNTKQKTKSKIRNTKTGLEFLVFVFRYCFDFRHLIFGFLILVIIIGIIFAKNQPIAIYGLYKLIEMAFFAWYTADFLQNKKNISFVTYALLCSVLLQSGLAIAQFWTHGSLNGIFYYIGERSFTAITPGIANASLGGQLILRPYGTLPHPNVLGGFLLISLIFLLSQWNTFQRKWFLLFISALLSGIAALLLSLSRTTIVLFGVLIVIGSIMGLRKKTRFRLPPRGLATSRRSTGRNDKIIWGASIVGMFGVLWSLRSFISLLWERFISTSFLEESFIIRADLTKSTIEMIQAYPFWGVGLMNFLVRLPSHAHLQNLYLTLQPVHNIFLLIFAETGIIGFLLILWFLFKTIRFVWLAVNTPLRTACFFMLGSIGILGMFDHYFLTLQQGQLLFAFVIGVCWSLHGVRGKRIGYSKKNKV